jgi:hypothetical protein
LFGAAPGRIGMLQQQPIQQRADPGCIRGTQQ